MAATSGNSHITDGAIFTQAQCDDYLTHITELQRDWDWMTGVNKTYKLRSYDYDGTTFSNPTDGDDFTGAGGHDFYPAWRTDNPDVTAVVQSDVNTYPYEQWDYFTNHRSDYDADAAQIKTDLDLMKARHVEMLATVD